MASENGSANKKRNAQFRYRIGNIFIDIKKIARFTQTAFEIFARFLYTAV